MKNMVPVGNMTFVEVYEILSDIVEGFESGDTLEGSFEFTLDEEGWGVRASYRIGNLEGQGGMRLIGEFVDTSSVIDAAHLERQRAFSERTFGPGRRTSGILDHIRKELMEVQDDPADLGEWVDVVILALDGAWRAGHEPQAIIDAIVAKQERNEAREWPDWREANPDEAIEHVRGEALNTAAQKVPPDHRDAQGHLVCGACGDEVAYCGRMHS